MNCKISKGKTVIPCSFFYPDLKICAQDKLGLTTDPPFLETRYIKHNLTVKPTVFIKEVHQYQPLMAVMSLEFAHSDVLQQEGQ